MVRYSKDDILMKEEIDDLIKACKNPNEKFIVTTLIYSGMRVGEFTHMKKEWIRWQEGKIVVPQKETCDRYCCQYSKHKKIIRKKKKKERIRIDGLWNPKTKEGARDIPLVNEEIKEVLRNWFNNHEGVKMTRIGVYKLLQRVAGRVKILKKVYPHSLRATFASIMASKGVSAASIQAIMGWKSFATAQSYVKAMEASKEIMEKW